MHERFVALSTHSLEYDTREKHSYDCVLTEIYGDQILVISDEVYKYMVYAGENSDDSGEVSGYTPDATTLPSPAIPVTPTVPGKKGEVKDASPLRPKRHVHFATLDGMWDRTITISSAGKTFSVTGWQVSVA